jgi:4-amino-4-deoxy-L-arabinose transferase-like glycosyltransferase
LSGRWWPLAVLALVAGLLRFAIAESTYPVALRGDEIYYVRVAGEIAAGHGHVHPGPTHDRAKRPPLQAWVLSRFMDADWSTTEEKAFESIHRLVRVEVVLGTLLVLAISLLGRAWFGPKAGLVAGLFAAFEPTLVAYSHYLWSETLCALLVAAALLGVVLAARKGSRAAARDRSKLAALGAGLAFGLASLTREVALPVAVVCAAWLVWREMRGARRAALARASILIGSTLLVIAPWTWRNYRVFHRFVPISTIGWIALGEGNTLDPTDWFRKPYPVAAMRAEVAHGKDEIERNEIAKAYTLRILRAEQPWWIFKKLVRNTAIYLSPDSNLLLKLREGRYGDVAPAWNRALEIATVLAFVFVFAFACLGIAGDPDRKSRALALAICGVILALHVLSFAVSRYRVPWMPLLIVYAGAALVDLPGALRRTSPRAKVITAAVIVFFLAVCVPYHRDELAALWECRAPAAQPEAEGG